MKNFLSILAILLAVTLNAQIPAYYNDVNLNLTGMSLKSELTSKITATHTNQLSYTPGVWNTLKVSDLDPTNSDNVILVYGWDDTDASLTNHRSRDKNLTDNGGNTPGRWNREHVFPKSKGTPDLGTSGPGSDAHNLRPADKIQNSNRGNKEYANGNGNAVSLGSYWYPGDEWKGDVARIYMYMYVRYTTRCKPGNACIGTPVSIDLNMVELLLQWNIEDPVSDFERTRNNEIYDVQGNRNPFIDNAYLATLIWGGSDAENVWIELGIDDAEHEEIKFSIYPNPSINGIVNVSFNTTQSLTKIEVFDISGKITNTYNEASLSSKTLTIANLNTGIYFLKVTTLTAVLTKKIVVK